MSPPPWPSSSGRGGTPRDAARGAGPAGCAGAGDDPSGMTDPGRIVVTPLGPADQPDLRALFVRNDRPEIVRDFHPFPLSDATAEAIAHHSGRDRFYGARM